MSKKKDISNVEKLLQKDYGDIIYSGDMILEKRGRAIPVALGLDIALKGGIQEGTIVSIAGVSGCGKTTLYLTILANCQKMGKKCYILDVENRLQHSLLKSIPDLNIDELTIISSSKEKFLTAEDYLTIMEKILTLEEDSVVVLDSVGMLCPSNTYSAEHTESRKMMSLSGLMYNSMRKISQVTANMRSTLILITHVQANPTGYGASEMGGNAMKFQASTRITCLSSTETEGKGGEKIGRESKFRIHKSALGPGTGDAIFYIRYNQGYDKYNDLFKMSEELGFISKSGSWYSYVTDSKKEIKVQGGESFLEELRENSELFTELDEKVRSMALTE